MALSTASIAVHGETLEQTSVRDLGRKVDHRTRRTILAVASCAASSFDMYTTHVVGSQSGAIETNPFLSGRAGKPSMFKIGLFKGVTCAATVWTARRDLSPAMDRLFDGSSIGQASLFTWAGVHNWSLKK